MTLRMTLMFPHLPVTFISSTMIEGSDLTSSNSQSGVPSGSAHSFLSTLNSSSCVKKVWRGVNKCA